MKKNNSYEKLPPIHPGEMLREEFLIPLGISQAELARSINVSTRRINEICQEKRGISTDTALRLGLYFQMGTRGAEFWMNLQQKYERECLKDTLAQEEKKISGEIRPLTKPKESSSFL